MALERQSRINQAGFLWRTRQELKSSSLLAPEMSWSRLESKFRKTRVALREQISAYFKKEEYGWLNGKVGAGSDLFSKYRGVIVANAKPPYDMLSYAYLSHEKNRFYDPEDSSNGSSLGKVIQLDPAEAEKGLKLLGEDLTRVVGKKGRIDKTSLTFFWVCRPETAQAVIGQLVEQKVLLSQSVNEYAVNPELVEKVDAKDKFEEVRNV